MNDRDPLLKAIDAIRAKPGLVPETDALLKMSAESAQGRPLAEIVAAMNCQITPLSVNASNTGHPLAWVHFIQWMSMCSESVELRTQFDRLRGTNVSRRGSPMNVMIDDATGKFEADARAFFDFCLDLYQRLPPPAAE